MQKSVCVQFNPELAVSMFEPLIYFKQASTNSDLFSSGKNQSQLFKLLHLGPEAFTLKLYEYISATDFFLSKQDHLSLARSKC